ncbi:DNA repair protein RecO [Patescibacteria group bacterium]|nr:DNA repair protein RecO [Patescibacteria group bacterium]
MPTYRTKGIVIKYSDLRETDRIITVFTANLGKVQAVAKGVRKTLSKLGGHLDLFNIVQLELANGRNLETVTGVQTVTNFSRIRTSLSKTSQVYYLTELIDQLVPAEYKDTRLFDLLASTLKILDSDVCDDEITESLLAQAFKVKLLQLLGFAPQLNQCGQCSQPITTTGSYFFSNQLGSLKCRSCWDSKNQGTEIALPALKILRVLARENLLYLSKVNASQQGLAEAERILDNYIKYIIEKEPRSLRFVAKVKGLAKRS